MKRSAVGGLTRDTSFDLVLSIILRDGSALSRGGFGREPLPPWFLARSAPATCQLQTLRITIFALDSSLPDTDLSCPQVLSICDWRWRQVGRSQS
jgi:hypothetical protein